MNHFLEKMAQITPWTNSGKHCSASNVGISIHPPFGMLMPGRSYSIPAYRYGFNGKENDNEVKGDGNQQDYGARMYDPRLKKFLSVDPLTKNYPWYTPYQFAGNKVINSIDLDGLEDVLSIETKYADGLRVVEVYYKDEAFYECQRQRAAALLGRLLNELPDEGALVVSVSFENDLIKTENVKMAYNSSAIVITNRAIANRFWSVMSDGDKLITALQGDQGFDAVSDVVIGAAGLLGEVLAAPESGGSSISGVAFSSDQIMGGLNKVESLYNGTYDRNKTYNPLKATLEDVGKAIGDKNNNAGKIYDAVNLGFNIKNFCMAKGKILTNGLDTKNSLDAGSNLGGTIKGINDAEKNINYGEK